MKAHILLVEDEPEYLTPFIEALKEEYELRDVEDLTEAVGTLASEDFSLVIVDIMLAIGRGKFPGVKDRRAGLQLIYFIRRGRTDHGIELKCRVDVPIIALTAVSDLSLEEELTEVRVPMIQKPFSLDNVMKGIVAMMEEVHHAR